MPNRCKPGDLAIVIQARNPENVGLIVTVQSPFSPSADAQFAEGGMLWLCECSQPMTWVRGGRTFTARSGPIPDALLQPIRAGGTGPKTTERERPLSMST